MRCVFSRRSWRPLLFLALVSAGCGGSDPVAPPAPDPGDPGPMSVDTVELQGELEGAIVSMEEPPEGRCASSNTHPVTHTLEAEGEVAPFGPVTLAATHCLDPENGMFTDGEGAIATAEDDTLRVTTQGRFTVSERDPETARPLAGGIEASLELDGGTGPYVEASTQQPIEVGGAWDLDEITMTLSGTFSF